LIFAEQQKCGIRSLNFIFAGQSFFICYTNFNNFFIDLFFPNLTSVYAGIDLFNGLVIDKNLPTNEIAGNRLSVISSNITVSDATRSPI